MNVKTYAFAVGICLIVSGAARAESGLASVYGNGDGYAGRRTASGERMNPHALTAAHRSLPFGSRVRVTIERTAVAQWFALRIAVPLYEDG